MGEEPKIIKCFNNIDRDGSTIARKVIGV